jgi:hypothetical protein
MINPDSEKFNFVVELTRALVARYKRNIEETAGIMLGDKDKERITKVYETLDNFESFVSEFISEHDLNTFSSLLDKLAVSDIVFTDKSNFESIAGTMAPVAGQQVPLTFEYNPNQAMYQGAVHVSGVRSKPQRINYANKGYDSGITDMTKSNKAISFDKKSGMPYDPLNPYVQ